MITSFWRLERAGFGPINPPDFLGDQAQRAACAALLDRHRAVVSRHTTLDDLTEGNPQNWRSGTMSREALVAFMGPVLPALLAAGFSLRHYRIDEDEGLGLLIRGDMAACHVEELQNSPYEAEINLPWHRELIRRAGALYGPWTGRQSYWETRLETEPARLTAQVDRWLNAHPDLLSAAITTA